MYAVMRTNSFDIDCDCCILFEDEDKAAAYLQWDWEQYYNIEIAEGTYLIESECCHEDLYAKVTFADGEFTEWTLTTVGTVEKEFEDMYLQLQRERV